MGRPKCPTRGEGQDIHPNTAAPILEYKHVERRFWKFGKRKNKLSLKERNGAGIGADAVRILWKAWGSQ